MSIIRLYSAQAGSASPDQTTAESTYYSDTIGSVRSVDDFLKDKRLVAYALRAYSFKGQDISNGDLRKILTSDPLDPKSFGNQKGNAGFRPLATAFNFGSDGKVLLVPKLQPQDRSDLVATSDLYVRQSMEQEAGADNDGVRLSCYTSSACRLRSKRPMEFLPIGHFCKSYKQRWPCRLRCRMLILMFRQT